MKVLRCVVLVGVLLGVLQAPAPSSAGGCLANRVCLYEETNLTGSFFSIGGKKRVVNLKGERNDSVSSVQNNRGGAVVLFAKKDGKGSLKYCVEPYDVANNLGLLNNGASSIKLTGRDTCGNA